MIGSEAEALAWLAQLPDANPAALERLERLAALLGAENSRQNLVSAASLAHMWQRHIVDSAQLLTLVPRETASPWLDLGTGAGFPGLVVAALRPEMEMLLVESRTRRIDWLARAVNLLALPNVQVIGSRLELVATRPVAVISARAFAPLDKLLELSARFSTSDTLWLLPKGRSARDEVDQLMGWEHLFHVERSITDPDAGIIVGTLAGDLTRQKGRKS